ncbi:MAG: hypothetical protein ACE5M4_03855 [Anaerolineales bacterium]
MRPARLPILAWAAILLIIPILAWANYRLTVNLGEGDGILNEWTVQQGLLVPSSDGRSEENEVAIERSFVRYPLPTLLAQGAMGLLPYSVVRTGWMTILSVAMVTGAFVGFAAADWKPSIRMLAFAAIVSLATYHALRGIVEGHFAVAQGLLMLGGLVAFQRRQDELAGLAFALSVSDPWMAAIVLPFVLLYAGRKRRWVVVTWTSAGIAAIFIVSILLDPGWPRRWIVGMVAPQAPSLAVSLPATLSDTFFRGSRALMWALIGILVVYMIREWTKSLGKDDHWFLWAAALTVAIAAILVPSSSPSAYLVLFPILTFVIGLAVQRWGKTGRIGGAFLLAIVLIASWILAVSSGGADLALRLLLPGFAAAGLLWMRWWSTRTYQLPD